MTLADENPPPHAASYETFRKEILLERVRWAALLALGPIAIAVPLNVWAFRTSLGPRLGFLAAIFGFCGVAALCARTRVAARHPEIFAGGFVLGVVLVAGRLVLLSPDDLDVLVGVVTASLLTTALVFPWGGWMQVGISLLVGVGYVWLLGPDSLAAGRFANIMIALLDGIFLSIVGAFTLDDQRRLAFDEHAQSRALAAQREQLLDVSHELNESLDLPDLSARIARRGRGLVGADSAALVLVDPEHGTVRTAAIDGELPHAFQAIMEREATASTEQPFFQELRRHACVEIPGGTPLDPIADVVAAFGIRRLLLVPIRREARLLGYLAFVHIATTRGFTAAEKRLALSLGQLAAVTLANASLVAELQHAHRVKSEFVSTMSHELRTPLGVIMGYAEILEDGDPSLHRDAVARVKRSSQELLEMIEETLNLSRLESGRDQPVLERVGVGDLWADLAVDLAALPRSEGVTLRFEPPPDAHVMTDRRKLRIVVKNLVGNALKFTPAGEVVASCRIDADGCTLVVRDTGIGIAPANLPRIFEMFQQVDSSDRRAYGGVGLGLHIVQRLVAQLGGLIEVESAVGAGSLFRIRFPPSTLAPSGRVAA